jgi:hypothetical protein
MFAGPGSSTATWYNQVYRQPSPLTSEFFSECNMKYLQEQVSKALSALTNQAEVEVLVDDQFKQTMFDVASRNPFLTWSGSGGVRLLNEMFIDWHVRGLYIGLRQQRLYDKYFIEGDRIKVMPWGDPTKVTRGEVTISPSGYLLANPWRHNHANFLQQVLGLKCC